MKHVCPFPGLNSESHLILFLKFWMLLPVCVLKRPMWAFLATQSNDKDIIVQFSYKTRSASDGHDGSILQLFKVRLTFSSSFLLGKWQETVYENSAACTLDPWGSPWAKKNCIKIKAKLKAAYVLFCTIFQLARPAFFRYKVLQCVIRCFIQGEFPSQYRKISL